jgi:hypothetical protein
LKTTKIYKKMGLKKGTTNNLAGRPKGKPNKVTADIKKWVDELIGKNLSVMERDLKKLAPKDRLVILERLMQYAIPKQQSISVEAQIQAEYRELEVLINKLPDEAINIITERIIRLNQLSDTNNKNKSDE